MKVLLLREAARPEKSVESRQLPSSETDEPQTHIEPLGTDLEGRVVFLLPLRLPVPSCGCPFTHTLTTEAHCDQVEQDFPGTNRCEFKDYHSPGNTTNEWEGH